jgi:hypothetical protein
MNVGTIPPPDVTLQSDVVERRVKALPTLPK